MSTLIPQFASKSRCDTSTHPDFAYLTNLPNRRKTPWNNSYITEAQGYYIPSNWDEHDLDQLLDHLIQSIQSDELSYIEAQLIVAGASYMYRPGNPNTQRILNDTNFGTQVIDWKPNIVRNGKRYQSENDRRFGLFVCGFLFKIIAKPPANIIKSWNHKSERFLKFYPNADAHYEWPIPSEQWLSGLQQQFRLDRTVLKTALRMINVLETSYQTSYDMETGLVQYLYSTPLSYTGMHTYKLFGEVRERINNDTNWLRSNLRAPVFNDALDTILDIHENWDCGSENFNPAFRYARIYGSGFFVGIQTKKCARLVYLLGHVVSKYDNHTRSSCKPEDIEGIQHLSAEIKVLLRRIADSLISAAIVDKPEDYAALVSKE